MKTVGDFMAHEYSTTLDLTSDEWLLALNDELFAINNQSGL